MATKEELYKLVSELPDSELDAARRYLEYLSNPNDPVLRALVETPEDDEPLSKDEEQAINEAKEDLKKGRFVTRDPDQAYYWTPEWQDSEEQARMDIMAGRTVVLKDVDEVKAHFQSLTEQANQDDQEK